MSPGWKASLRRSPASTRRLSATSRSRLSFSSPSGVTETGSLRSISQPSEMITRRMDPTDLRAGLAEQLAGSEPIDAQTFNSACFMLSRALEDLALSVPEAAPLAASHAQQAPSPRRRLRNAQSEVFESTREHEAGRVESLGVDRLCAAEPFGEPGPQIGGVHAPGYHFRWLGDGSKRTCLADT